MCVNNQRNHVVSGIVTPYTANCEISGDMPDPVVKRFLNGTSMDVLPVVSHDRSAVRMTVRLTISVQSGPTYEHTVITGPSVTGGERTLSEKVEVKSDQQKQVHTATSTTTKENHIPGPVRVEQPSVVVRRVNTDVMVRDGATAYFTVDAWQEVGGRGKAVLVLLRPKVLGAVAGN
jgi:hypothetical protein